MNNRVLSWLKILCVLVYFLISLGGLVRNLGAGLSCPDWPLCFGKLIPHFDIQIFSEFFHRLIAGSVSIIFLILAVIVAGQAPLRALLGRLFFIAFLLLLSQVVLGGLTVLKLLQSEIVTLHLITGTLFFAVLLIATLRLHRFGERVSTTEIQADKKRAEPTSTWRLAIVAIIALFMQIMLGGVVSSHGAGLACPDFPTCLGHLWPSTGLEGLVGIHMVHRIGALVACVAILTFALRAQLDRQLPRHIIWKSRLLILLLILQITLGILNVLLHIPVSVGVAHLAVAEGLFALLLITAYEIRHFQLR